MSLRETKSNRKEVNLIFLLFFPKCSLHSECRNFKLELELESLNMDSKYSKLKLNIHITQVELELNQCYKALSRFN